MLFSELVQSTTTRRLLCHKPFDELITFIANTSFQELAKYMNHINCHDSEIKNKLRLLGLQKETIDEEMELLIDQKQIPDLEALVKSLRSGKYQLTRKFI